MPIIFMVAEKSTIYFTRSGNARAFLEKVVEVHQEDLKGRVLIKPNLVSNEPYPTTTHPELFKELLVLLKGRAKLAAGDAVAADLREPGAALKNHVLTRTATEQGVKFHDFYQEGMLERKSPLGDLLRFSAIPSTFDLVISLPVLKAHINVLITGALKNQFGFLDRKDRFKVHFQGAGLMERAIVGINQLAPAHLFIVDFRETLLNSNEVRHGGRVSKGGWIFAGKDPVALDWFGFSLLKELEPKLSGKRPEDIPYLDLARKAGLGNVQFELVKI